MFCGIKHFNVLTFVPAVNQLQQTLASIQELLVQQQQKIQELSRELSAAEVTTLTHLNTREQLWVYFKDEKIYSSFIIIVL